jgi:hypothetical protein
MTRNPEQLSLLVSGPVLVSHGRFEWTYLLSRTFDVDLEGHNKNPPYES